MKGSRISTPFFIFIYGMVFVPINVENNKNKKYELFKQMQQ